MTFNHGQFDLAYFDTEIFEEEILLGDGSSINPKRLFFENINLNDQISRRLDFVRRYVETINLGDNFVRGAWILDRIYNELIRISDGGVFPADLHMLLLESINLNEYLNVGFSEDLMLLAGDIKPEILFSEIVTPEMLMCFSERGVPIARSIDPIIYGDVDQSGKVDLTDLAFMVDFVLGYRPMPPKGSRIFLAGDLNGDGVINRADINLLTDFIIGRITKFPVES